MRNDSLVHGVHLQRFASEQQDFELFAATQPTYP
jgi:hypothetical protein